MKQPYWPEKIFGIGFVLSIQDYKADAYQSKVQLIHKLANKKCQIFAFFNHFSNLAFHYNIQSIINVPELMLRILHSKGN